MHNITRGGAGRMHQQQSNSTHIYCMCNASCQFVVLVCLPLRDKETFLRHSYRALAHARANVYAPTRLSVPLLAATPPRWGTRCEVVHFSRAGCMPSQDVVLPLRSMVTFAFSNIGILCALLLPDVHWNMLCLVTHTCHICPFLLPL